MESIATTLVSWTLKFIALIWALTIAWSCYAILIAWHASILEARKKRHEHMARRINGEHNVSR